jgi:hypothetical protein
MDRMDRMDGMDGMDRMDGMDGMDRMDEVDGPAARASLQRRHPAGCSAGILPAVAPASCRL